MIFFISFENSPIKHNKKEIESLHTKLEDIDITSFYITDGKKSLSKGLGKKSDNE